MLSTARDKRSLKKMYMSLILIYHPDKVHRITTTDLEKIGIRVSSKDFNEELELNHEFYLEILDTTSKALNCVFRDLERILPSVSTTAPSQSTFSSTSYTKSDSFQEADSSSAPCSWCEGDCTCKPDPKRSSDPRFSNPKPYGWDSRYQTGSGKTKCDTHYETHNVFGEDRKFKVYEGGVNFDTDDVYSDDDEDTWHWAPQQKYYPGPNGMEFRYAKNPFECGYGGSDGCDYCGKRTCNCFGQMEEEEEERYGWRSNEERDFYEREEEDEEEEDPEERNERMFREMRRGFY
ncbi:hypothetical protein YASMINEVIRUS_591 [Yasminevirus sp. GU-2018]|uniref:Uncharacterized protein n=1 Tax=Yasminevirus sp. GU-2018 TaxID=2420051 RepID=A0A5K0U7Y6_9VIRU|nr:hypothetical protein YASMINEVIRUS_591 [Yasminevirus sp. GU-2018]